MFGTIKNHVPKLMAERRETWRDLMFGAHLVQETAKSWAEFEGRSAPTRCEAETMAKLCTHFGVQPGEIWEHIPAN